MSRKESADKPYKQKCININVNEDKEELRFVSSAARRHERSRLQTGDVQSPRRDREVGWHLVFAQWALSTWRFMRAKRSTQRTC